MKKLFTVSSKTFQTLREAEAQLECWRKSGALDSQARVYQIAKIYVPKITLKEYK